jgi:hypothetical protein
VEVIAKQSKTEAIFVKEKRQTKKFVRLGTQATQAARDQHPPWLRKQSNKATTQPTINKWGYRLTYGAGRYP